jgi:DNA-binding NarL/FixJ family response regulator
MHMTLWQGGDEAGALVRESLRGLCVLAGIDFDAVDTREALLAAATWSRWASDTHILVIDCYHGEPGDIERCAAVIAPTTWPVHIVHPDGQVVRDLEGIAGRPLSWLPADFTVAVLREKLHVLRAVAVATAEAEAGGARPALTPREREVAELVAEGRSNREIEGALHLTKNTVKTYVRTLLRKFDVETRPKLIVAYRAGKKEG